MGYSVNEIVQRDKRVGQWTDESDETVALLKFD